MVGVPLVVELFLNKLLLLYLIKKIIQKKKIAL